MEGGEGEEEEDGRKEMEEGEEDGRRKGATGKTGSESATSAERRR